MKSILIIILLLINTIAFAQTKKFRWTTELCELEGVYDAKKYTEAQLKNTLRLGSTAGFDILIDATPIEYADIKNLSIENLDEEYATKSGELEKLDIVETAYWEAIRQKKLKELKQLYTLKRATMEAYANPLKLKEITFAEACVRKYANPLINGGDELLGVWRLVNKDSQTRNASPERLQRIFDEQFNSPDRLKYAQMEVMSFGWWNCANELVVRVDNYEENEREFKKLFARTKTIGCDEP